MRLVGLGRRPLLRGPLAAPREPPLAARADTAMRLLPEPLGPARLPRGPRPDGAAGRTPPLRLLGRAPSPRRRRGPRAEAVRLAPPGGGQDRRTPSGSLPPPARAKDSPDHA